MSIANVRPFIMPEIITDSCSGQEIKQLNVVHDYVSIGCMDTNKEAFARRLNLALDAAGFPKRNQGRQKAVASAFGVTGTAAWKWMDGETMPASKRIQDMAKRLGVRGEWLFTGDGPMKDDQTNLSELHATYLNTEIATWDSSTPPAEDAVEVPFYMEVQATAGAGTVVKSEPGGPKRWFPQSILKSASVPPEAAACVIVYGNSMEPVLPDGTTIGVDTSNTTIKDGKMYAIDQDGMLRVKLLYRLPHNGLRLRSYNHAEWPDENLNEEDALHVRVIGRVFWYSALI